MGSRLFLCDLCIQLALKRRFYLKISGTGDHTFERRLRLGGPLLKDNIATMVLER